MPNEQAQQGIPDLNDPNVRLGRNAAMAAMAARRRETVLNDMEPEDAAALAATPRTVEAPPNAVPSGEQDPEEASAAAADAAAEAERRRLEEAAAAPALDPTQQVARQTDELILTPDDLKQVKVRLVINGEEQMVTGEEAIRRAQKISAADDYFQQAKELIKEARSIKSAPATPAGTPAATPAATPATPAGEDLVGQAIDQMFQGNEQEAKRLFAQAINGGTSGQPADVNQITREVEQSIVIRSALRQFAKDHKDIVADPYARELADRFLHQELVERGVTRLEELSADAIPEAMSAAGTRTKDYFRVKAGLPATASQRGSPAASLSERLQRKQGIDELPAASTRAASTVPAPQTTSDVIARMRQARGQLPAS